MAVVVYMRTNTFCLMKNLHEAPHTHEIERNKKKVTRIAISHALSSKFHRARQRQLREDSKAIPRGINGQLLVSAPAAYISQTFTLSCVSVTKMHARILCFPCVVASFLLFF